MTSAKCSHCGAVVTSETRKRNVCSACQHPLVLPLPDAPEVNESWDDSPEYRQLASPGIAGELVLRFVSLRTSLTFIVVGCLLAISSWTTNLILHSIIFDNLPKEPNTTLTAIAFSCTLFNWAGMIAIIIGIWMGSNVFPSSHAAVGLSIFYNLCVIGYIISYIVNRFAKFQNSIDFAAVDPWAENTIKMLNYLIFGFGGLAYILHTFYLVYIAHYFRRFGLVTGLLVFLLTSLLTIVIIIILLVQIRQWMDEPETPKIIIPTLIVTIPCIAMAIWYTIVVMMLRSTVVKEIKRLLQSIGV